MIDIKALNRLEPQKGRLLLSEPFLEDPNFRRTVVLLCEHNEEGSFGFVLNKFIDVKVHHILNNFPETDNRLGVGGPVNQEALFYIHTLGEHLGQSTEIAPGLFMGGSFEQLHLLCETGQATSENLRFFVGYSGWVEGQLEQELQQNSWIVAETSPELVMNTTKEEELWGDVLRSMGSRYSMLANFPEDPSLN